MWNARLDTGNGAMNKTDKNPQIPVLCSGGRVQTRNKISKICSKLDDDKGYGKNWAGKGNRERQGLSGGISFLSWVVWKSLAKKVVVKQRLGGGGRASPGEAQRLWGACIPGVFKAGWAQRAKGSDGVEERSFIYRLLYIIPGCIGVSQGKRKDWGRCGSLVCKCISYLWLPNKLPPKLVT